MSAINRTTPERARVLTMEMQADSDQDLADALYNLSCQIERGEISHGFSGGYSSGCIYELRAGNTASHDEFVVKLNEYLADMKKGGQP